LPENLRKFGVRRQQLDEALAESGILVLLVDHDVFRDVEESRRIGAIIYDTRGAWDDAVPMAERSGGRGAQPAPPSANRTAWRLQ
jgi:UDP-N-acetyl-D-mannosaminuronic acid dehydrogenase